MDAEQYISEVVRVIRENFRSNDETGGMPVASAAYVIRRTLGVSQTAFGFLKFKNVLENLERRGEIKTGVDSKGAYALWLADAEKQPAATTRLAVYKALRNEVWFAFVSELPSGKRFLNATTGEIRTGLDAAPDNEGWLEITPLDPSSERKLARDFLQQQGINDKAIEDAISRENWYVDFPKALSEKHPGLAAEWKRNRSHRVIGIVEDWCRNHDVQKQIVFQEISPKPEVRLPAPTGGVEQDLRKLLLAAINRMPTHELLRLHLPAYELVSTLRPDLLS